MWRAPLDVFQTEPAKESPLFGTKNFICTRTLALRPPKLRSMWRCRLLNSLANI
jgi:hypothetical protein